MSGCGRLPAGGIDRLHRRRSEHPQQRSLRGGLVLRPFFDEAQGRHTIKLCAGTACYVKGIKEVLTRVCGHYHLAEGDTTEDRRFSLETVRCLGACGLAPVMVVDQDTHGAVSSEKVLDILDNYE